MILKNKLALITGANRGIGLSILKKFSENGADIIACARSKNEKFEQLIFDISKKFKNKITPVYFNLLNENEIELGIERINSISNNIEIIVNNAGINQVSLFQMTSIEKIREIFDINFFSHLRLTQKLMKIINLNDWTLFAHLLIDHGRAVCIANRPRCEACIVAELCPSNKGGN